MTAPELKLMVTGGCGFLGGYILREAAKRGHETVALARSETAAGAVTALGARPVTGDLNDARSLVDAFTAADCDVLVSMASLDFGHASAIIGAAERAGNQAGGVRLDNGGRHIAASHLQAGAASYGADGQGVRTRLDDPAADDDLRRSRRPEPLPAASAAAPRAGAARPGGTHFQQPVRAADVANAVLRRRASCAAGHVYDVAGPEPMTFTELLRRLARAAASRRFVPMPLSPLRAAARGYELLSRNPKIRAEQLRGSPRTQPSRLTRRSATWTMLPTRSLRAFSPRPAPWDWPA